LKIKNSYTSKVFFFLIISFLKRICWPKKNQIYKTQEQDLQKGNLQKIKIKNKKKGKKIAYFVFTNAFNFLGFNLASMHACSQAYFPLLDFLNQVKHF
jgi:hypothetical protein